MKESKEDKFNRIAWATKFYGYYETKSGKVPIYTNPYIEEGFLYFVNDDFLIKNLNKTMAKKTKLIPAKNIVILKSGEDKTASGLAIVNDKKEKPETGVVFKIGNGKKPVPFKVGDRIVYRKYMENTTSIEGVNYNFIDFKDIIGVIG